MSELSNELPIEMPRAAVIRTGRALALATLSALVLRLAAFSYGDPEPYSSLRETYFSTAAAVASGHGLIMETPVATKARSGFEVPTSSVQFMKQRQAEGGRVDPENPYPRNVHGWRAATRHPHGYGMLIHSLYSVANYDLMLLSLHLIQVVADVIACIFVFIFARNVFDRRIGVIAAWLYALCPPAVFLCLDCLPDAFHGFFISGVLALASSARNGRVDRVILAGAALGAACYFRTEYLLMPAALSVAIIATGRGLYRSVFLFGAMTATMLVILLPGALWMAWATGEMRFTSTTGGGGLYVCLGEDPQNPWGIVCQDGWIHADAMNRGFDTAWGPEADKYYGAKFREYVRTYPMRYARTVLLQRLPLALAPPYETGNRTSRKEFTFTKYRKEEGLTRWGVIRKHPLTVLRYMGPQIAMAAYSGLLTLCVVFVTFSRRRDWRRLTWIVLPWAYPIVSISLLKAIEPRNLAPTLIPAMVAAAATIAWFVDRRAARRQSRGLSAA